MYTRQHYETFARIIRNRLNDTTDAAHRRGIMYLVDDIERLFAGDNQRFDVERFRSACKPQRS